MHKNQSNPSVALSIQGLKKSFAAKSVHKNVTFDLQHHEILGLFGGSGTGKSLILRTIIGLDFPDSGSIWYQNTDLTRLTERELFPVRQKISYVFQNGALFDSLTVEENIAYPLRAHTHLTNAEIRKRVHEMLDLIDMPGTENLLPNELSGGMQKRAGFARANILNPDIVLFDEPTAGLDPVNTQRLIQTIRRFKERGLTGIFVTHDIPAAFEVCDRIAILQDGKIHTLLTTDLMKQSDDPLVKSFTTGAYLK